MKTCKKCGKVYQNEFDSFYVSEIKEDEFGDRKIIFKARCIPCISEEQRIYRENNREKIRAMFRARNWKRKLKKEKKEFYATKI